MSFIPPLANVLVQRGFLERKIQDALEPLLGFDKLAEIDPIEARVGESKTLTRRALLPPVTSDVVPTATVYTDLNNGITPQQLSYEQYTTTIAKRRGMMTLDLELDEAKIVSEFVSNWEALAGQAAQSRDSRAAQYLYSAADSGNTFALGAGTVATGNMTVHVDNINGFDTAYTAALAAGGSPGVPQPTSPANPLAASIISQQAGASFNTSITVLVVGVTPDATNTSTGAGSGTAYDRSGNVILQLPAGSAATLAMSAGDVLVASDGSAVIRPNGKLSRAQLTGTDLGTLSILTRAKAKLKLRGVPKMPNGLYACMIDSALWADLEQDLGFRTATQGQWGQVGSFFTNGQTNRALEMEFVETNYNPVFSIPGQSNVVARHALVCGMGCIVKSPSLGFERAAKRASGADLDDEGSIGPAGATDIRLVDGVKMVTRQPLDPEATVVTQTWSWQMGHAVATDVTSTPLVIPSTDYSRYKREVLIEMGSAA